MTEPPLELTIHGAISGISGFYEEVNRVFMAEENWRLGESLDAFDDLLHGGYGAAKGSGPLILHWRDMDRTRDALGPDATKAWLLAKLSSGRFDARLLRGQLAALEDGGGETYFDWVMEIIAAHSRIRLIPAPS